MAASAGADWRPDAGDHLSPTRKRQPSHLTVQFNPEALRIGTRRPLHFPHQEGGAVGTLRYDIHLDRRAVRSRSPPGPRHTPGPIEVRGLGNTRPDQVFPHPGDVRRPLPLYLLQDRGPPVAPLTGSGSAPQTGTRTGGKGLQCDTATAYSPVARPRTADPAGRGPTPAADQAGGRATRLAFPGDRRSPTGGGSPGRSG